MFSHSAFIAFDDREALELFNMFTNVGGGTRSCFNGVSGKMGEVGAATTLFFSKGFIW